MTALTFIETAARILAGAAPNRRRAPWELLAQWRRFVDDSVSGYPWGWYDFDNERRVRGAIQLLIDDETLRSMPEFFGWAEQVDSVDANYRGLLVALPDVAGNQAWWLAGVPRFTGRELAADLRGMFGLEVDIRE